LAALELFAKEGFAATSTNKIAKKAGVSEGLIFRHFCSKEGLLRAIIKNGEERIKIIFADIIFETDPKQLIHKLIDLSLTIANNKDEADFWKLQYKIKWELEQYGEHKMEPLEHALTQSFSKLGYQNPEMEARLLLVNLDGLATRFFLQKQFDLQSMIDFLHIKYTT
jgi:AcrR family transcriptional regulator